jgi:hypothetical protein
MNLLTKSRLLIPNRIFNFKNIFSFCTKENKTADYNQYEKEWTEMYIQKLKQNKEYLEKQLSEPQRKEIELIVEAQMSLNETEKKYFNVIFKKKIRELTGVDPITQIFSNPSDLVKKENLWPKENPNWFKTPHLQNTVSAFTGGQVVAAGI